MKSKRANQYLKDNREEIEINLETGETEQMIWPKDAKRAVEIAEEDIAEKAAKAFCFCKCGVGPCIMKQVGREECKDLREFKRKMEE